MNSSDTQKNEKLNKRKNRLLTALLCVSVLILAALVLNLLNGGLWILSGLNGKSAYELAVENGFRGSLEEWLDSLGGSQGQEGSDGQDGENGKSAYELAVENGFRGTLQEWLLSLSFGEDGKDGLNGQDGQDGADGSDGKDGQDGQNGVSIVSLFINEQGHLIVLLSDGSRIDAGYAGSLIPSPGIQTDYELALKNGFVGTLHDWLCSFLDGSRPESSLTDIRINTKGELFLTLSDGSSLSAGKIPADGYLSDSVDSNGIRPRFELVVLNREATALNLRPAPDITSTPIVAQIKSGEELVCIGSGTVNGEQFLKFCRQGQICYAKAKYFTLKYASEQAYSEMNLPDRLILKDNQTFRFVTEEIIPWASPAYTLEFRYSDPSAVRTSDEISHSIKAALHSSAEETGNLTVILWKLTDEGLLMVQKKEVAVTVVPDQPLPSLNGLFIGDSRFSRGNFISLLLENNPMIRSVGTVTNLSGIPCEARGGWKAENYQKSPSVRIGGETLENPFYDPALKAFHFAYYMDRLKETEPDLKLDFAVIYLGANDGFNHKSVESLKLMIDSIHSYDPGIVVYIMTEYLSPADGLPFSEDLRRRGQFEYFSLQQQAFEGKESEGIVTVPAFLSVDSFSDRILSTDETGNTAVADKIHLGSQGYKRMADVLSAYLAKYSKS